MSDRSTGSSRRLALGGLAALVVFLAVVYGAASALRAHARRDWPRLVAAPQPIAPPVPLDADAWPAVTRALLAAPAHPAVDVRSLDAQVDPSALESALAPYATSLDHFDVALQRGAAAFQSEAPEHAAPTSQLVRVTRAWALRARLRALRGDGSAALVDLARLHTFSARLGQRPGNWLGFMLSLEVSRIALAEAARTVARAPVTEASVAAWERSLDEALALPSAAPAAVQGECAYIEALFRRFDGATSAELLATTPADGSAPPSPGHSLFPSRWLYDAGETLAAHRDQCARDLRAASGPYGARHFTPRREYAPQGALDFGRYLDNRVGRVLLDIGAAESSGYLRRDDQMYAARRVARLAVAIARHRLARGAFPETLDALSPECLPAWVRALPAAPAAQWDAASRTLTPRGVEGNFAVPWTFSP